MEGKEEAEDQEEGGNREKTGLRVAGSSGKERLTERLRLKITICTSYRVSDSYIISELHVHKVVTAAFDGATPIRYHGTGLLSRARIMALSKHRTT